MLCEATEEATTEEEKEAAAGAELKTKTPHIDVGKNGFEKLVKKISFFEIGKSKK